MAKANTQVPILSTQLGTYATATTIDNTRGVLRTSATHKLAKAQEFATDWFDATPLDDLLATPAPTSVTPKCSSTSCSSGPKRTRSTSCCREGDDDRILEAADIILHEGFADLTILGDPDSILTRAKQLGLDLSAATLLDPAHYDGLEEFAETYFQLRKHKGISIDDAREKMKDISYFATMMVHLGKADGMVSGAAHTTAHTIRPSFEIIKTKPGVATVSSIFLMCLEDYVLAFGDCAVNIDPTPAQLADIAISSAETASQFGVEPRVALLSYSTGTSGSGADVDKVREAVAIVKDSDMPYPVDGPIQFDAAVDATVGAAKAPDSVVAGRATVLVFPDLNTGNNTYKAVQRTAGAVAVGPILQGLKKPINDLSRGALVEDIVNTVAVTATQAQSSSGAPLEHCIRH
ncbi:MAG: phosphate acetyltransferase [Lawsonella clevelandensis]